MTTYYGLYGQKVQYLASDPSNVQIGQVWYNSTSAVLKVRAVSTVGTWAAGGNLNTARQGMMGSSSGSPTASLTAAGITTVNLSASESYNGTSWTNTPSINTARSTGGGAGTATSALIFGGDTGSPTSASESYNGTSWTSTPSLNTARRNMAGFGASNTSALGFGGNQNPSTVETSTESYNGTSWTNNPTGLNTGRTNLTGVGILTAGLAFGGQPIPGISGVTESWNGSSWTTVASMNTAKNGPAGAGTQTAAVSFGGNLAPGPLTGATELWNGTSWTTNPNSMATARSTMTKATASSDGLAVGGATPSVTAATEEFTGPGVGETKTVTVS